MVSPCWNIPLQCVFGVGARRESLGREVFGVEPQTSKWIRERRLCSTVLFPGSGNVPLEIDPL